MPNETTPPSLGKLPAARPAAERTGGMTGADSLSPLLTSEDVCRICQISYSTFRRRMREGWILGVRIGGLWRFRREDLERALSTPPPKIKTIPVLSEVVELSPSVRRAIERGWIT